MHSCVYVFIPKKGDVEELVAKAMQPFSDDVEVPPYKAYLDPVEIAVMAKHYRLRKSDLKKLAQRMDDWRGEPGGLDDRGLFAIRTCNPKGKWDWYEIGGRWNGWTRRNVVDAKSLLARKGLKKILPACMVTPGGSWHEHEKFVSEGWAKWHVDRKKPGAWLREVKAQLATYHDHRVACVDMHS